MTRELRLMSLAACLAVACGPAGGEEPVDAPVEWQTSTWRGDATLTLPQAMEPTSHPAVLTVRESGEGADGVLVVSLGDKLSVGQRVTVREGGELELGEAICSDALAPRCDEYVEAIGRPRLSVRVEDAERRLRASDGALADLVLLRDDWQRAPHDGFRPQTVGWPPCLEVNDYEVLAKGSWDGRILALPSLGWAKNPILGVHCAWIHGDGPAAPLECSPSAYIDTYSDEERFELAQAEVDVDLEAETMRASFASDDGVVTLDGALDSFVVLNQGYLARQYRWSGRLLVDEQVLGDFVFYSWGDASLWTHNELEACFEE